MTMISVEAYSAIGAGVASYLLYFHHGEHFLYPQRYLQVFGITILAGSIFLSQNSKLAFSAALTVALKLAGLYLFGLYTSCILWRAFLNPLNKIPGPFAARIWKLDHVLRNTKQDAHLQLTKRHEKYGNFVRIGPNDLSVIDAAAVPILNGGQSKCTKAPWYDQDSPRISMHTTRDRAMHDRRRRIWAPAFSDKALRGYENRIQELSDLLITKLGESKGEPINATNLLNLYSFDTMGSLAFGADFGMLESGEVHWAIKLLNDGMGAYALQMPQWMFRLVAAIPGILAGYWSFIKFCDNKMKERIDMHESVDPSKPDIAHPLIDHYNSSENKKDLWSLLCGDARLIIVAGSDTTAATLSYLFYHIASKPEWQKKLREEIQKIKRDNKASSPVIPDAWIKDAPVLNGMINETLRLNPPVPSGVFRKTPKEGITIRDTFVPGNTVIQQPMYAMSRSKENYEKPEEFIPDRWNEKSNMIKEKDAFIPFSTGPFGCIGKNLAYTEIRTVTSQIIDQFDIGLAKGEDGKKLLMEAHDHFTLGLQPLMLTFKKRN